MPLVAEWPPEWANGPPQSPRRVPAEKRAVPPDRPTLPAEFVPSDSAQERTFQRSEMGGKRTSASLAREPRPGYHEPLSVLRRFEWTDPLTRVPITY